MKLLVVSDLHYSLRQFDWLVANATYFDAVIIAGDMMELASPVDSDIQAAVVERYFEKICGTTPLVVCSGNHDLVDEGDGRRSAEWLLDLSVPGLVVDYGVFENEALRILAFPWWEDPGQQERMRSVVESLHRSPDRASRPELWVHHAPPRGTKTAWSGKKDYGDPAIADWIRRYSPDLVLSGHLHNAPYLEGGSWIDRMGTTVITNSGRQPGPTPATIVVELSEASLTWCGMEGCEREPLAP